MNQYLHTARFKFVDVSVVMTQTNKTIERVDNANYCLFYPISTALLSNFCTTGKVAAKDASSTSTPSSYTARDLRITKENLFMVVALWMESFPVEREGIEPYNRVGAVLVLPTDMIYAVDCSRNGVHGVARLLMAHQDIVHDCKVFVSRKPCSFCTKLLVQSKVKRVFYLPIEPEYYTEDEGEYKDETLRVDELFKVSAIGQSVFVPRAGGEVLVNTGKKYETPEKVREKIKAQLMEKYWKKNWMENAKTKLPWPAFDENMVVQVNNDFDSILRWMAIILVGSEKGYEFKSTPSQNGEDQPKPFNPEEKDFERLQAEHLVTLATFLAERTDDPKTGVGAVVINKEKEIVALGWNGFPTKTLYGEFPRASDGDKTVQDKKYPYVIHAEQNALLMRNTKNIAGGTLFVTKTPCDECTPLLEMQGIKTVVLGVTHLKREKKQGIIYEKFQEKVSSGDFTCFVMEAKVDESAPPTKKRKLDFDNE